MDWEEEQAEFAGVLEIAAQARLQYQLEYHDYLNHTPKPQLRNGLIELPKIRSQAALGHDIGTFSERTSRIRILISKMENENNFTGHGMVRYQMDTYALSRRTAERDVSTARKYVLGSYNIPDAELKEGIKASLAGTAMSLHAKHSEKTQAANALGKMMGWHTQTLILPDVSEASKAFNAAQSQLLANPAIRELLMKNDEIAATLADHAPLICDDGVEGLVQDPLMAVLSPTESDATPDRPGETGTTS